MTENNPAPVTPTEKEPSFFAENKKMIVIGVIVLLMLIFIATNLHEVEFSLLFIPIKMPMVVCILLFFFIGAVTAWVYSFYGKKELKKKIKELERKLKG